MASVLNNPDTGLSSANSGNFFDNVIESFGLGKNANSGAKASSTPVEENTGYQSLDPTGYEQSLWTLEKQIELDDMERAFNSAEAQKTRDWQEYMSNTSVQRAVEDIKKAGLNPWLALNGGSTNGASTPSGATASSNSGSAHVPSADIYKAYLQMISSLVSSASSIFRVIAKV